MIERASIPQWPIDQIFSAAEFDGACVLVQHPVA
jgi:hypothetical protein